MKKILFLLTLVSSMFAKDNLSLLIPLYSHPSQWNNFIDRFQIAQKKDITTYAIINPHNGPSTKVDKSYIKGIALLKEYNIKVIGYVYTQYGKRNPYKVKEDIYKWSNFYQEHGVEGIFFDETATDKKFLEHYKELLSYTRSLDFKFNILNAGYTTHIDYINSGLAQVIVTYENFYKSFINSFPEQRNKATKNTKLSLLLHTMEEKDFAQAMRLAKKRGFDYIYLTEDKMPNPWDTLSKYQYKQF